MKTSKSNKIGMVWKNTSFGLLAFLALGLAMPQTLIAKSANPYVFRDSYCFDYNEITVCYANSGIIQSVNTPSGNTMSFGIGSSSYQEIDSSGAILYEDTLTYRTQGLTIDDALQEFQQAFTQELTVGSGSCKTTYEFHLVKGEILFDRTTYCY